MLSVLLIAAVPAQADTIRFGDVIALATINGQSGRPNVDLRLRSVTQQTGSVTAQQQRQTASAGNNSQERKNAQTPAEGASSAGNADSSITGVTVQQQPGAVQVETIELGDIQGTICDCPWPTPPGGGFPKLPFLALAGIPLLFLGGDSSTPPGDIIRIPPPPTPPPVPEIPEPATILLLGSGLAALGAGARRRRQAAAAARSNGEDAEVLDVRGA